MVHYCMICFWKGKTLSLLYDLFLKRKKLFRCCMIYLWKGKTFLFLYDLF